MNKKFICRIVIDLLMTIVLLVLMARQLTGESAHEWLGAGMFVLWISHHILNRNWYGHLFKGRYTAVRMIQTAVDLLVLLSMLALMVSGMILSREVFAFLPISKGIAFARSLHVFSAFWGFVLMALHLGLHWNMILGMVRKAAGAALSKQMKIVLRMMAALIAGYGFYAFIKNQFLSYMFLLSDFVFFDYERAVPLFFAEYIAIMGLFVFMAHYTWRGIQKLSERRKKIATTDCNVVSTKK